MSDWVSTRIVDAYKMWAARISWSDLMAPSAGIGKGIQEAARLGRDVVDHYDAQIDDAGYNTMIDGVSDPSTIRLGAAALITAVDL